MCFQRCREKEDKQGTPAETAQVSEVDPGQAGCPGVNLQPQGCIRDGAALVKHCRGEWALPGNISLEDLLPSHVPLLHELAERSQPALPGMLHDQSWEDRTDHPLQVRSDSASTTQEFGRANVPMYQIYQCTKGTNVPNTQLALTDLPAALCSAGALQKGGAGKSCQVSDNN